VNGMFEKLKLSRGSPGASGLNDPPSRPVVWRGTGASRRSPGQTVLLRGQLSLNSWLIRLLGSFSTKPTFSAACMTKVIKSWPILLGEPGGLPIRLAGGVPLNASGLP
jgi:hypothetical protein